MRNEAIFIIVLTVAFITGFSIPSYDLSSESTMESSITDWGWTSRYCDKVSYVYMKLNGVITSKQTFHEYCNI